MGRITHSASAPGGGGATKGTRPSCMHWSNAGCEIATARRGPPRRNPENSVRSQSPAVQRSPENITSAVAAARGARGRYRSRMGMDLEQVALQPPPGRWTASASLVGVVQPVCRAARTAVHLGKSGSRRGDHAYPDKPFRKWCNMARHHRVLDRAMSQPHSPRLMRFLAQPEALR